MYNKQRSITPGRNRRATTTKIGHEDNYWWTPELKGLVTDKKKLYQKSLSTQDPDEKTVHTV